MSEKRSYKIKGFSTNVSGEIDRLRSQVELFWHKELKCYKQFGLSDGMHVLECGSGPGHVTESLLKEFPNCKATAIEIDSYIIEVLKTVSHDKKFNVAQQSITDLGFKDSTFDFVITRLVLEHLPDPEKALWEVHRVLRPGGIAVFVDNDFEMHLKTYPEIPEIKILYEAYCQSRISEGGNPKIGRQLPNLMADCGFKNVDLEIICAHNTITGDEIFLKSEGVGIPAQLVKDGFLESSILDTLALKWHKVLNTKKHSIFRQLFVCSGAKIDGAKKAKTQEREASVRTENLVEERISRDISRQAILQYLTQLMVSVTKLDPAIVQEASLINDLGLDSLGAVEVISTLDDEWGITLSLMDFFEGQSIAQVVDKIAQVLTEKQGDRGRENDQTAVSAHYESVRSEDVIEWEEGEIL